MAVNKDRQSFFEKLATKVTKATGSPPVIVIAFLTVLAWGATGPIFDYSETWQLVINTGTTIITFLMVFLIQKTQNKDSLAIQIKLNELVAAHQFASNHIVDVEDMTEEELEAIERYYAKLADLAQKQKAIKELYSLEQAQIRHDAKNKKPGKST